MRVLERPSISLSLFLCTFSLHLTFSSHQPWEIISPPVYFCTSALSYLPNWGGYGRHSAWKKGIQMSIKIYFRPKCWESFFFFHILHLGNGYSRAVQRYPWYIHKIQNKAMSPLYNGMSYSHGSDCKDPKSNFFLQSNEIPFTMIRKERSDQRNHGGVLLHGWQKENTKAVISYDLSSSQSQR